MMCKAEKIKGKADLLPAYHTEKQQTAPAYKLI